ncbi:MAG: hypothetical protein IJ201_00310 [Solobacterium sp.]|nr:hypothetical protein [Solobacterium sp.]
MISTLMRFGDSNEGEDSITITLDRIVKTVGSREEICMDLRTIAHGLRKRIKEEAKSKEDEVALQTMYETAFLEGFRMSGKEIEDLDQDLYGRILDELSEAEKEGAMRS